MKGGESLNKELNTLLADLRNYKDRLSVALKIADISIFEVDLKNQLYTFFENSESIFEKKGKQERREREEKQNSTTKD